MNLNKILCWLNEGIYFLLSVIIRGKYNLVIINDLRIKFISNDLSFLMNDKTVARIFIMKSHSPRLSVEYVYGSHRP